MTPSEDEPGNHDVSDGATTDPQNSGDTKRRGTGRTSALVTARVLLALLSTVALLGTGIAWATVNWFDSNTPTTSAIEDVGTAPDAPPANDGAEDILLVGTDSRTDAQGNPLPTRVLKQLRTQASPGTNTDTLIVLRIPHNGGKAYAVSIPRDSYVAIPGHGMGKINSAYGVAKADARKRFAAQGGMSQAEIETRSDQAGQRSLLQTVQDFTGIRIDHYAEINLYGFYLLTKSIGGVQVCLKRATSDKDSGADFPAGHQVISGADALSFVRQRKGLPRGDLDRIVRQQVFLAAAARKVLSAGTLSRPSKLGSLVDTVRKSIVLDKGLDILSFLQRAQDLTSGHVTFVTIPVVNSNARSPEGASIVAVDVAAVKSFVRGLITQAPASGATSGAPAPSTTPPQTTGHALPLRPSGAATAGVRLRPLALAAPLHRAGPITPNDPHCVN
ncbi:MAG: LCP family protein [Sciscionella sp.]